MPLIKEGQIIQDTWLRIQNDERVPDDGDVLLPELRVRVQFDDLAKREGRLGAELFPDDEADSLEEYLHKIDMIVINFPKYADGRGYSQAQVLRRAGFKGEIRAIGDVLRDQLFYMKRCGFDAFQMEREDALEAYEAAMAEMSEVYQPAAHGLTTVLERRMAARKA